MAYNPPVSDRGLPLRVEGEYLLLERKDMEVEFKIPQWGKKTGKGKIYLSNARIIFIAKDHSNQKDLKSFDIPLDSISKFAFQQPIFGANYLGGTVSPIYNLIPADTPFKLWFMSGGC